MSNRKTGKDAWQQVTLEDVCIKIQDGAHNSPKKQFNTGGPGRYLYVTSKNIRNNFIDLSNISYVDQSFHDEIYPRCTPAIGDVLLTKDGANTGNVTLNTISEPFSLLSSVALIKTKRPLLLPEFLAYYLQSPHGLDQITGQMTGTAIKRIILRDLKAAKIPLPPKNEQERLIAILDEAFEVVERAQAVTRLNISNSRALLDSALQSLLERDTQAAHVCLDSVCEISSMLIDPREPLYVDLPHVGAGNIESRTGVLRDVQTAREEGLISGKFVFDETMVLYSKIRPYLEKATRPDFRGLCSADMYPLKPFHGKITRDFLFYILLSRSFTQYAIAGSARSGMPKVNRDHLFKYRFRLPLVAEQNRITEKLDSLKSETERLDGIYKQKQVNLEDLKQSLLQQAFSDNL